MRPFLVLALATLFLGLSLSGCLSETTEPDGEPSVASKPYLMEGDWSTPRQDVIADKMEPFKVMVPVRDGVEISLGIFLPDVPGCDLLASDVPEECQVPVLVDAGPYYTDRVGIDKGRPQWVEWLVPRGYAVVQMALRGTGESGGCMAFKDPNDAEDASDVTDWIVEQPWAKPAVAFGGRSYDGTSAWAAAASGNPHVKTILPISGASDAPKLYFRNGTHELRVLIPHIPIYWASYAIGAGGSDPLYRGTDIVANVCPEVVEPHLFGPLGAITGDASNPYWQARIFDDDILEKYEGSVWVVHGMQDWNVDPSQAVPLINHMIDAGIETRGWLGQWGHHYPDHSPEHPNVRWDWSDQIVSWLDYYLRGEGEQPFLGVEVELDDYTWRQTARYPEPLPREDVELSGSGTVSALQPLTFTGEAPASGAASGLITVSLEVTPTTATGGSLMLELYNDDQDKRIGWGVLNLQYHNGGNTNPVVLTPGSTLTVTVRFEPAESAIEAGDALRLVVGKDGVQDINPSLDPSPVLIDSATVHLPIQRVIEPLAIPLPPGDFRLA